MTTATRAHSTNAALDRVLTVQLVVAWAGEEQRLGWWRTDLASEYGGEDLFRRLLPHTWRWAVLQGAREAAMRCDSALRARSAEPDQLLTLFRFGFELDERLDERLQDLKGSAQPPEGALPGLSEVVTLEWSAVAFSRWVTAQGVHQAWVEPTGRRLLAMPSALEARAEALASALMPIAAGYPLPHFRIYP